MEYKISFFNSIADKSPSEISILELLEAIKTGKYKEKIEKLRKEANLVKKEQLKKGLLSATISGIFKEGHKAENLIVHSGLIQIDIDKVNDLQKAIESLNNDKFTFACFISPSGNGIKVIVKIQPGISLHLQQFKELEQYYLRTYKQIIDPQCKDVNRLMYVSYDESLFYNPDSLQWEGDNQKLFEDAIKYIEKYEKFNDGNRNNYVYKLARNCRGKEISIEYTLQEIINRFQSETLPEKEIYKTVKSAYTNNSKNLYQIGINNGTNHESDSEKYLSKIEQVESFINDNYEVRNNIVSCQIEYRPENSEQDFEFLNVDTVWRKLEHKGISYPISKLRSLLNSDFIPLYNPLQSYFENLKEWHETDIDYISKLCEYIPAKNSEFLKIHLKKWLVRSVSCALNEHYVNKQVLVFVNPMHSSGKTTLCRWLSPPILRRYYCESFTFDSEGQNKLDSNFLINLDELASISKYDINSLKSIVSMLSVKSRLKYAARDTFRFRRANFVGSTNKTDFLTDETGSVRWLCIEFIGKINFAYSTEMIIDDIWRQAYSLFKSKFSFELTTKEENEIQKLNKQFQFYSPERELILELFEPVEKEDSADCLPASAIEKELKQKFPEFRLSSQIIGKELTFLGFKKGRYKEEINGYMNVGYYVKRK